MNIPGLYYQIETKRRAAGELARAARLPDCEPLTAHEKSLTAEQLALQSEDLSEFAKANEQVIQNINNLLHYLATSKFQSRYRKLAITALEDAQNWLRRENGDKPEPPTP